MHVKSGYWKTGYTVGESVPVTGLVYVKSGYWKTGYTVGEVAPVIDKQYPLVGITRTYILSNVKEARPLTGIKRRYP